ncbi:MAG: BON domain-containing protein [Candidatus Loosdrechtia sp.]|uniref:BON domain-containing protein n=1 Tax=Candidatus Loosdrechtia sp. TaxID=3101272 RepID=UPI003A770924|nr:MAG: BON domain-containing protein [Candidatus Jettenia sp. AMX2]
MVNLFKNVIILVILTLAMHNTGIRADEAQVAENDAIITQKVEDALAADPDFNQLSITVETRDGVVHLDGFVGTPGQIDKAGEIAAGVEGVKSVRNTLISVQESLGEYIDDSVIIGRIMSSFVVEPSVSALNIKVNALNGLVQLSGFADSAEEASKAEEIAAGTKGVRLVRNNIIVKPEGEEGESVGEFIDDSAITAKIKGAFILDRTIRLLDIKVTTFKGVVQLSGFVNFRQEAQKAEETVTGVKGVKSVRNDIIIIGPPPK